MTTTFTLALERRDTYVRAYEITDREGRDLYRLVKQVVATIESGYRCDRADGHFAVGIDENANAAINKALAQVHYFDENLGPEK